MSDKLNNRDSGPTFDDDETAEDIVTHVANALASFIPRPHAQPKPPSKSDIVAYFRDLPKHPERLKNFETFWHKALNADLDSDDFVFIFYSTALAIKKPDKKNAQDALNIFKFLRKNIAIWEGALTQKQTGTMSTKNIRHLLYAYETAQIMPTRSFLVQVENAILENGTNLTERQISDFLKPYAVLGIEPSDYALDALEWHLNGTELGNRAEILWSCAVLDAISDRKKPIYARMARTIANKTMQDSLNRLSKAQQSMINDACLWFTGQSPFKTPQKGTERSSKWERRLNTLFDGHSALRPADKFLPELGKKTDDAFVDSKSKAHFHFESDGPYHFIYNPRDHRLTYNGTTIFQSHLMADLYPERVFVRLPFTTQQDMERHLNGTFRNTLTRTVRRAGYKKPTVNRALIIVPKQSGYGVVQLRSHAISLPA